MSNNNVAIIPARGGSKRLPGKNVRMLNGKPLVQYTIEAVLGSGRFEKIILSSDSDEILAVADQFEQVTPEKRNPDLAGDKVKVIDLVKSIADRPRYLEQYDLIGLFLPTCPFRTARHIIEGVELLEPEDYSVVSCKEMEDPVQLSLTKDENNVANMEAIMSPSPLVTGQTRSQDFQKVFRVNGGFYIARLSEFIKKDNFFQGQVKAYQMEGIYSVDIDYQINFEWAEYILSKGHIKLT